MKRKHKYLVTSAAGIFPVIGLGSTLAEAMRKARVDKYTDKDKFKIFKVINEEIVEVGMNGRQK